LITFGQLFLAISIPTVVALIGILLNQSSNKELTSEVKNFRLEIAAKFESVNVRLAIIETKMGLPIPPQKDKEQAAA
jgi:hypothetical protein